MKMKKLVAVLALISFNAHAAPDCHELPSCESLGFICSSEECGDLKALSCPFDLSKKTCWPKETNCELGSILYSDFKCYEAACGRTPIAIIYDTENRLAVQITTPPNLLWSTAADDFDNNIPDLEDCATSILALSTCATNGKENTKIIIDFGQANNIPYPAAEYCHNATWGNVSAGTWWLPSLAEMAALDNISQSSTLLKDNLNKYDLFKKGMVLPVSNEVDYKFSYNYGPSREVQYSYNKNYGTYYVHCIINY